MSRKGTEMSLPQELEVLADELDLSTKWYEARFKRYQSQSSRHEAISFIAARMRNDADQTRRRKSHDTGYTK